jgi:hypothetical protein
MSNGIVENDAECMPATGTETADTMTHVDPINTAGTANWTMVDGKNHTLSLA